MSVRSKPFKASQTHSSAQAVVLAAQLPDQTEHEVSTSLAEITHLAATLGIEVVTSVVQKRPAITGSYLGEGKLREVAQLLEDHGENRRS